jgi:hypothetical protein
MAASPSPYQSPTPVEVERPSWRLFYQGKRARARLLREMESFNVELSVLEQQNNSSNFPWAAAAHDQMKSAEKYLSDRDIEGGWFCLHAAKRHAVFGFSDEEVAIRSSILRKEGDKLLGWRREALLELLSGNEVEKSRDRLVQAMAIKDEASADQYHKIWLLGDQLGVLVIVSFASSVLYCISLLFLKFMRVSPDWGWQEWGFRRVSVVLLFGLLGAAFSATQAIFQLPETMRIPERVQNRLVTIARVLFGSVGGIAGYAFYQSKVLQLSFGSPGALGAELALGFIFGYGGERLIAKVAGSVGASHSG